MIPVVRLVEAINLIVEHAKQSGLRQDIAADMRVDIVFGQAVDRAAFEGLLEAQWRQAGGAPGAVIEGNKHHLNINGVTVSFRVAPTWKKEHP